MVKGEFSGEWRASKNQNHCKRRNLTCRCFGGLEWFELTIDMFFPISIYPDTWCTPGVVSHIPELLTYRNLVLLRFGESDVNTRWTESEGTAVARVPVQTRESKARLTLRTTCRPICILRREFDGGSPSSTQVPFDCMGICTLPCGQIDSAVPVLVL